MCPLWIIFTVIVWEWKQRKVVATDENACIHTEFQASSESWQLRITFAIVCLSGSSTNRFACWVANVVIPLKEELL
jgi:hypothetical protein